MKLSSQSVESTTSVVERYPEAVRLPNPWIAVIVVIVAFLAASVLAQQLLLIWPAAHHWTAKHTTNWFDNDVWAQFVYVSIAYGLLMATIIWIVRYRKVSLRAIGLTKPRWSHIGWALAALPLYYVAYFVIVQATAALVPTLNVNQKQQIGFSGAHGTLPLIITFISLAVIPPLVEETVMRGFVFSSLRAKLKLPLAVLVTSALFAVGHLQFGSGAPLLWIAALDTFTLSLFLIYLRQKTGSLWASVVLHGLKNGIAFLYLFVFHAS